MRALKTFLLLSTVLAQAALCQSSPACPTSRSPHARSADSLALDIFNRVEDPGGHVDAPMALSQLRRAVTAGPLSVDAWGSVIGVGQFFGGADSVLTLVRAARTAWPGCSLRDLRSLVQHRIRVDSAGQRRILEAIEH